MAARTLSKRQREHLIEWIAEGLTTEEIKAKAAKFDLPFAAGKGLIYYYRTKCKFEIERMEEEYKDGALRCGVARKMERINRLKELAEQIRSDLLEGGKMWNPVIEMTDSGEGENRSRITLKFNEAAVRQYRGVLEDIAREVGDRGKPGKVEPNREPMEINVVYSPPSMDPRLQKPYVPIGDADEAVEEENRGPKSTTE